MQRALTVANGCFETAPTLNQPQLLQHQRLRTLGVTSNHCEAKGRSSLRKALQDITHNKAQWLLGTSEGREVAFAIGGASCSACSCCSAKASA
eukprot:1220947-Amphidinium_carterae.2